LLDATDEELLRVCISVISALTGANTANQNIFRDNNGLPALEVLLKKVHAQSKESFVLNTIHCVAAVISNNNVRSRDFLKKETKISDTLNEIRQASQYSKIVQKTGSSCSCTNR